MDVGVAQLNSLDLAMLASKNVLPAVRKPTILAIDDDEDHLLLLQYFLESFRCVLIHLQNGKHVWSAIRNHQPDLVLLDIVMPELSGTELLRQLRRNPHMRDVPVIALTALARDEDRQNLLAAGFSDYISKPYMLEDLEKIIARYLILDRV